MGAFEHMTVLLSFVYALAITHLFSGVARLIMSRDAVRFSGLLSLHIILITVLLVHNWIALWRLHSIAQWDFQAVLIQFLSVTALYFCAFFVIPECDDMEAHFWKQRRAIVGSQLIGILLAACSNLPYMRTASVREFLYINLPLAPSIILILVRLIFARRWVQWTSGSISVALTILQVSGLMSHSG